LLGSLGLTFRRKRLKFNPSNLNQLDDLLDKQR